MNCFVSLSRTQFLIIVLCFCFHASAAVATLYNCIIVESSKMVNIVQSAYEQIETAVWSEGNCSKWFDTNRGIKQGCIMRPLLFALFVDDMQHHLSGGVLMGRVHCNTLTYANDMVLLAESPQELQEMIDQASRYCKKWSLKISEIKSKVIIIWDGRGRKFSDEKWLLDTVKLKDLKECK